MNDLMGGGDPPSLALRPDPSPRIRTDGNGIHHPHRAARPHPGRAQCIILTLDVDVLGRPRPVRAQRARLPREEPCRRAGCGGRFPPRRIRPRARKSGRVPCPRSVSSFWTEATHRPGPAPAGPLSTAAGVLATADPLPGVGEVVLVGGGRSATSPTSVSTSRLLLHLHSNSSARLVTPPRTRGVCRGRRPRLAPGPVPPPPTPAGGVPASTSPSSTAWPNRRRSTRSRHTTSTGSTSCARVACGRPVPADHRAVRRLGRRSRATVLVVGASSGIGRARMPVARCAPPLCVVGCRRRPVADAVGSDMRSPMSPRSPTSPGSRPTSQRLTHRLLRGRRASGLFVTKTQASFTERMAETGPGPANLAAAFPDAAPTSS